jgi:hypothetical protein
MVRGTGDVSNSPGIGTGGGSVFDDVIASTQAGSGTGGGSA